MGAPPIPPVTGTDLEAHVEALVGYADILAGPGVERGLIGPREVPRLWERHLFNCAALAPLLETDERVADVGSGAGLPGMVLAIVRPDLEFVLIESLLRRAEFLIEVVAELGLTNVTVRRDRAEECSDLRGSFDVVVARAVAPLIRLLPATSGLLRPGGRLLAMKGSSVAAEIEAARPALRRADAREVAVRNIAAPYLLEPVTVLDIRSGSPGSGVSRGTRR